MRRPTATTRSLTAPLLVAVAAVSAHAQQPDRPGRAPAGPTDQAQPLRATIVTGLGVKTLRIANTRAAESAATLVDRVGDKPSPPDAQPQTYTLTSRVIVKADAPRLDALEAQGFAVERFGALEGYAFVSAGSVGDALALAQAIRAMPGVERSTVELGRPFASRAIPTDPNIPDAWHLINTDRPELDINADGAWLRGYTGQGVTVGIVDEGVYSFHEDLFANRDTSLIQNNTASFHGTAVAGIAVAAGNNGLGSAGLAYNATFGSQVYAQFAPTEQLNAEALLFKNSEIDVKNNSWGPIDNRTFHALDPLEADALESGATTGRGGLGTVFVWAAGNGSFSDRPEYDGFAGSRHTIAIGAVGHLGRRASYNERGSAMMAVTYSDGNEDANGEELDIFTTRYPAFQGNNYFPSFGGTSAAAPLATGAVALTLEANPGLTARDVQHIVVSTAKPIDDEDLFWSPNAAGRLFNDNYGFGVLDAEAMVLAAEGWRPVGPAVAFDAGTAVSNTAVPDNDDENPVTLTFTVSPQIKVEHAEIRVRMQGDHIGDIRLELVSPWGTVSTLAETRSVAVDDMDHLFTSVRHWDERAAGTWTLRVSDGRAGDIHTLLDATLVIHGTCLADQDRSGAVDAADFQAWAANFQAADPDADINGDASINGSDFFAWVRYAELGC